MSHPLNLEDFKSQVLSNAKHRFLSLLHDSESWNNLKTTIDKVESFEQVILIGIGGSSQGVLSLVNMWEPSKITTNKLVVLDNTEPTFVKQQFDKVTNPNKCLWIVVSKSGRTSETAILLQCALDRFGTESSKLPGQVIVITGKEENPLRKWAADGHFSILEFTQGLDGRFSAISPSSLLILKLIGANVDEILEGAQNQVKDFEPIKKLSEFLLQNKSDGSAHSVTCFWLYAPMFKEFGQWLGQLWAESLGKSAEPSKQASTPLICIGSNAQHSLLQQIEEGQKDKNHVFISLNSIESPKVNKVFREEFDFLKGKDLNTLTQQFALSTYDSLSKGEQAAIFLESSAMTFQQMGALHCFFHLVVALVGEYKGIEIYGQPGVEKSKRIFRNY